MSPDKDNKNIKQIIYDTYKSRSFVKSIFVGFVSLINQIFFLYLFTDLLYLNYLTSSVLAFVITVFVNFNLQKYWSFGDKGEYEIGKKMAKFGLLSVSNLFLNSLLMYIFVDIFNVWYLMSQFLITATLFLFNFFIYKYYIFI